MEITVSQQQSRVLVTIMRVSGEVDSSNYQEFTSAAREAISNGAQYIVLDLAGCEYMSSAGIRSLNEIFLVFKHTFSQDETGQRSAHLKLLNPPEKLRSIFSISGVDAFFEVHTDLETAVASF